MAEDKQEMDYLDIDAVINGQNYVCLSFVSPESVIEERNAFNVSKFLQSINNFNQKLFLLSAP